MVDKAPFGSNPVAVLVIALVGWIIIRLVRAMLQEAGVDLKASAGWEASDDGAHHHDRSADHAGDGGGHGGDAGGGDGGH